MHDAGISSLFPEIATPVYALVRNDSGGAEIAIGLCRGSTRVCGGSRKVVFRRQAALCSRFAAGKDHYAFLQNT